MMKRQALMVVLLGAVALLVGGLAPPGGAAAQPQPTMVIFPASGPCDATVEVTGQDFPPDTAIELSLTIHPLGSGLDFRTLTRLTGLASAVTDPNGYFALTITLGFLGCEAAALDGLGPASGQVWVVADVEQPPQGGELEPLAQASYSYTTFRVAEPTPTLTISPLTGQCDATVEMTGQHFPPDGDVALYIARPHSEGAIGTLGTAAASSSGDFTTTVSLGVAGCEAATLDTRANSPGEPNEISIYGDISGTPFPPGLTYARYTYTNTFPGGGVTPSALPQTGQGGTSPGMDMRPLVVVAALLSVVLLTGGLLALRRKLY
jgi:hypothetical protein